MTGRPLRHRRRHPTSHSVSAVDAIETATKRKRHLAAVRTIAVAALAQAEHRAVDLPARANTCVAAEDVVARLIRYAVAVVAVVCHRRHVAAAEVRASEQRKVARPNIVLVLAENHVTQRLEVNREAPTTLKSVAIADHVTIDCGVMCRLTAKINLLTNPVTASRLMLRHRRHREKCLENLQQHQNRQNR